MKKTLLLALLLIPSIASAAWYDFLNPFNWFKGEETLTLGAPINRIERSIIPETDSVYYLGTTTPSTKAWLGVISDQFCLTGDNCISTWSGAGGGGGVGWASTTDDIESIYFYGTGNVGIGTSSPQTPLTIVTDGVEGIPAVFTYGESNGFRFYRSHGTEASPSATLVNSLIGFMGGHGYGDTGFSSASKALVAMRTAQQWTDSAQGTYITFDTTPLNSTSRAERVRVDSTGNVGIGTTTPNSLLDVAGSSIPTITISNKTNGNWTAGDQLGNLDFYSSDTNDALPGVAARVGAVVENTAGSEVGLGLSTFNVTGPTERVRIDASGDLGVASSTPWGKLSVTNTGTGPSFVVEDSTSPDSTPFIIDAAGNVAIGIGTPHSTLRVAGTNTALPTTDVYQQLEVTSTGVARLSLGTLTSAVGSAGLGTGVIQALTNGGGFTNLALNPSGGNVGVATSAPYAKFSVTNTGTGPSFVVEDSTSPDTSPFVITAAGDVGIGTANPDRLTTVQGASTAYLNIKTTSGAEELLYGVDSNGGIVAVQTADPLIFRTNALEKMRITSDGLVGIGTSTPTESLVIDKGSIGSGVTDASLVLSASYGGATTVNTLDFLINDSVSSPAARIGNPTNGSSGELSFYTTSNFITTASTERVRISGTGNVGIGTTTPGTTLDVSGTSSNIAIGSNILARLSNINSVNGGVGSGLAFSRASRATGLMANMAVIDTTDQAGTGVAPTADLRFGVTNAGTLSEAMRIVGSTGNVGIATTSPHEKLTVNGNVFIAGALTSTSTTATSSFAGPVRNANGDPFAIEATYIVSTSTRSGNYTSLQEAIDALPSTGGKIFVRAGTYNVTATGGISINKSKIVIEGEGNNTTFQCNGANVGICFSVATTTNLSQITLKNFKILELNGANVGIGLDTGDTSNLTTENLRIESFHIGHLFNDTQNVSFYNQHYNNLYFDNDICVQIGGSLANSNSWYSMRCRPKAGGGGPGFSIDNARGIALYSPDIEPATAAGIIGLYLSPTAREINVYNPWFENNATNTQISAGARRINIFGGTITGDNSTSQVEDLATTTCLYNVNVNADQVSYCGVNSGTTVNYKQAIGTTTANNALELGGGQIGITAGNASTNEKLFNIYNSGYNLRMSLGYDATNVGLQFNNRSGVPLMSLREAGRLGLATTSPAVLLDVYSTATSTIRADSNSVTQGGCIILKDTDGVGYTQVTAADGVLSAKISTTGTTCN